MEEGFPLEPCSLGIAKGAYEAALKYSKERVQFGKPISAFQGISFKLADMATEIEASELLLHKSAFEKNAGRKMTNSGLWLKCMPLKLACALQMKLFRFMVDMDIQRIFQWKNFTEILSYVLLVKGLLKFKK